MKLLTFDENTTNIVLSIFLGLVILVILTNVYLSSLFGGAINFLILPIPVILLLILIWKPSLINATL